MIKARASYARFEIIFWDMLFWLMKGLQHIRDTWISFIRPIHPSARLHLVFLFCVCILGFGLGFVIGYLKVNVPGW
jgi:hypothetical protein